MKCFILKGLMNQRMQLECGASVTEANEVLEAVDERRCLLMSLNRSLVED